MSKGIIDKTRKAVSDVLGKVSSLPPNASDKASLDANKANIDEYRNALRTPVSAPAKVPVASPAQRINPGARYGDKPGEQRIDTSSITKPLGSFHKGTDRVPESGVYKLDKDEAVLNKKDATKMRDIKDHMHLAAAALAHDGETVSHKEEKPPKELKHIITRKSKNGKIIHEHHHTEPMHHPMEEHVSSNQDEMVDHMLNHMGEQNPGEADADDGKSGIEETESGAESQDEALGFKG